jgi:hypothetical protein
VYGDKPSVFRPSGGKQVIISLIVHQARISEVFIEEGIGIGQNVLFTAGDQQEEQDGQEALSTSHEISLFKCTEISQESGLIVLTADT